MSPRTKLLVYGNLVIFGAVFIGSLIYIVKQYRKEKEREPFQAQIEKYLEQPTNELAHDFKLPKEALKIPGKIVIVDLKTKRIDPVFNDLPASLKPANPDEVKTIVWVEYVFEDRGKYVGGGIAYQTNGRLILIDASSKKYLWTKTVNGRMPPETHYTKNRGSNYIEYPREQIVQYLQQIQLSE